MEVLEVAGVGALAIAAIVMNFSGERNRDLTRYFWIQIVVGATRDKI